MALNCHNNMGICKALVYQSRPHQRCCQWMLIKFM